jgi:hypothetical protein
MQRSMFAIVVAAGLLFPFPNTAHASIFGEENVTLGAILKETILQLAELKNIFQSSQDTLHLLDDVNRGINDTLHLAETLGIHIDPGLYRGLRDVDRTVYAIEEIYGRPVDSPVATVQRNTDETVAEAISFNNELDDYTRRLDGIGENIKAISSVSSPGVATKLTAQTLGVMIHVLNQEIRATGRSLKLQAQAMAVQNKHEKDSTAQYLNGTQNLVQKMHECQTTFEVPRF